MAAALCVAPHEALIRQGARVVVEGVWSPMPLHCTFVPARAAHVYLPFAPVWVVFAGDGFWWSVVVTSSGRDSALSRVVCSLIRPSTSVSSACTTHDANSCNCYSEP